MLHVKPELRANCGPPATGQTITRKARWRERQRRGVLVAQVEVSAVGLDLLIATHWLAEVDAGNPAAIGRAISALLEDSAKQR